MLPGGIDRSQVILPSRLARRVSELYPELTFSQAKRAVEEGRVSIDGAIVQSAGASVPAGAQVLWDRNRPLTRSFQNLRVELLHQDRDVAVANKPAGLLTVPTSDRERATLISRIALAVASRRGERPFVAAVHRLDRDTSGLVVFAISRRALESLSAQLRDRSMTRLYDAVVEGVVDVEAGSFDSALIGDGLRRRRWVVRPGEHGKPAVTHWRVVRRFAEATHVRVALETGRTHQIRIHFAVAGFPVVGDPVYRAGRGAPMRVDFARQALHAAELLFRHPADDQAMRFRVPLPEDMERLLARLARQRSKR